MRRLPPLNSLRAFEAAARHESFSRAAAELSVTHGAISKQVALLEDRLGQGLFRRSPGGVVLTAAGKAYQAEISEALDRIAAATTRVSRQGFPDVLDISAPPTFTIQWLVPRLSRFQIRYPLLETRLSTRRESVNVALRGADVVIRRGPETWKGVYSRLVLQEAITPVCHPRIGTRLRHVSDLGQQVWLHAEARPSDWNAWLDAAGATGLAPKQLSRFDHSALALEAAGDGMGVAMGPLSMIGGELRSGKLQMPFPRRVVATPGYYVICRKGRESEAKIRQFCEWLAAEGHAAGNSADGASPRHTSPAGSVSRARSGRKKFTRQ
jgi:LysR family glycine cleavage system transcriptional activator